MPKLTFQQETFEITPSKSVLENLLDRGYLIPNSCRAGICQACKVKLVSGAVLPQAQQGLPATQVNAGIFLACCCFPSDDLAVELVDASSVSHEAEVLDHFMLNQDVLCVRLETDFKWQAGQVINCIKDDTVIRSYSIASRSADGMIELHIRIYPHGRFGQWIKHKVAIGDSLRIEAPFGDCVYDPASYQQPLVMVATGTGLAPIYGVLKDALANHHQAQIDLYVASGDYEGFYYLDKLDALAQKHPQLKLHKVMRRGGEASPANDIDIGNVEEIVLARHASLKDHRVYLCGAPSMVAQLKKASFMRGAKMQDILCDAFEAAQS
ncbi:2Fe-2S iron-sulfur cluster binding domain-containing protein [Litoribrevibacter albus]|uniref:Ferredoxin n=1 Tax=Litoribrevibacter albus TaxID=1473156 RepID=A0AA37SFD2_9GAMM|nr:2Fe-2S iron-sulfur cluster binding domain-containing protein [Litoribrevibacter albus]GLQ33019.1 ferredoxin [Litoribrevibacter albus]